MKVSDSNLLIYRDKLVQLPIGELHLFDKIAIIEFAEGWHITYDNSRPIFEEISKFFDLSSCFGLISNRVNSYSIQPMDSAKVKEEFPNMYGYGVVGYGKAGEMSADIENDFCKTQDVKFNSLEDAYHTLSERVHQLCENGRPKSA